MSPRWWKILLRVGLVLACLAIVGAISLRRYQRSAGIDFYHYWAIETALARGDLRGTSPYRSPRPYEDVLAGIAAATPDPRLRAAAAFRSQLDLTGTPLQYTLFRILPDDYSTAFGLYQILQTCCFAAAIGLVFRARWPSWPAAVAAIAVLVLFYLPLEWDLLVGNLSAVQTCAVTALAWAIHRRGIPPLGMQPDLFSALFGVALVGLTLFKPNVLLICGALTLCLWLRERPPVGKAIAAAALTSVALLVIPCLYFGNWSVWMDWNRTMRGEGDASPFLASEWGNYATVGLLREDFGVGYFTALTLVLLLFGAGAVLGAWRSGCRWNSFPSILRSSFGDPFRAAGLAILLTAAASPLYWPHYYLFCCVVALYFLLPPWNSPLAPALALTSIVLTSGWLAPLLGAAGLPRLVLYSPAVGWLILVPLLFLGLDEALPAPRPLELDSPRSTA